MHVKVSDSSVKSRSSKLTTDKKVIELPVEPEGYILISMLKAEFPDACGLKFKTEHSSWKEYNIYCFAIYSHKNQLRNQKKKSISMYYY